MKKLHNCSWEMVTFTKEVLMRERGSEAKGHSSRIRNIVV